MEKALLGNEMVIKFVFLCFKLLRERFCATEDLQEEDDRNYHEDLTNLEHVLPEEFLIILPVLLMDNLAEVREVDEPIPDNIVGQVNDLLLQGVQTQHLHGCMQVLK